MVRFVFSVEDLARTRFAISPMAGLHPAVAWADDHVDVTSDHEATIDLDGRGLLLMPSAFQWACPATIDQAPWQPTLIYPARGISTLWDDGAHAPDGLARLLGATRAPRSSTSTHRDRPPSSPGGSRSAPRGRHTTSPLSVTPG